VTDHKAIMSDPVPLLVAPSFTRPLRLNSRLLRPLPQSLWNISCSMCDKRQSVWEHVDLDDLGARKGTPVCSLCWLYESEWGKKRREDLDQMIHAVEVEKGEIFRKMADGSLWSCRDADNILGAIAVTSRIAHHHAMMSLFGGDGGT